MLTRKLRSRSPGSASRKPAKVAATALCTSTSFVSEDTQARAVALTDDQQRDGRRQCAGISELGQLVATDDGGASTIEPCKIHRCRLVDQQISVQVRLLKITAKIETIGSTKDLPVDIADGIARTVRPIIMEFQPVASPW